MSVSVTTGVVLGKHRRPTCRRDRPRQAARDLGATVELGCAQDHVRERGWYGGRLVGRGDGLTERGGELVRVACAEVAAAGRFRETLQARRLRVARQAEPDDVHDEIDAGGFELAARARMDRRCSSPRRRRRG
jgi:hypothetical protein